MANIKDMTVTELKALAYDFLATIENAQLSIRRINEELQSRNTPLPEVKADVAPVA